jgi:hypothetical protein
VFGTKCAAVMKTENVAEFSFARSIILGFSLFKMPLLVMYRE